MKEPDLAAMLSESKERLKEAGFEAHDYVLVVGGVKIPAVAISDEMAETTARSIAATRRAFGDSFGPGSRIVLTRVSDGATILDIEGDRLGDETLDEALRDGTDFRALAKALTDGTAYRKVE